MAVPQNVFVQRNVDPMAIPEIVDPFVEVMATIMQICANWIDMHAA